MGGAEDRQDRAAVRVSSVMTSKTRSGKIMRRLLRNIAEGEELGDTTTLRDPAIVEDLKRQADARSAGSRPRLPDDL